jgi:RNA polymerase subunit RPABC4/transcription elongation factor Spt4
MKTFGCNFGADAFARFFELVIVPDVIKVDDGHFYEAHYTCGTFNTRRQNTRKGITRNQIAPCCKTNFTEDWSSYWFYVKVDMSAIPSYEGIAHPLSSPIEALTDVCTAAYNHRAAGIRSCENAFHLVSTILGGRDIIEEFTAAQIWPISYGWAPTEIVNFIVNWATQEVPFPKFGLQLRDGQSADDFMLEIERRVNLMIGEYTMNEYKAYKNLVKHNKRINWVFSEVCGDKSFRSRRPGRKLKMPAVAVASCSAAPPKALRRSSKSSLSIADETTSSSVQPSKTKSLESSKRKRKSSEQVSDAEHQAASSLAQMSRKKAKKAVKKIVSFEVRWVPSAFDHDLFVESSQKGFFFWPLSRLNFHGHCPSGSKNEFVDIDSFSDAAPEVQKEVVSAAAVEPPAAAIDTIVSQPIHPQDEASPEFTKELELTIHRGENSVQDAPLVKIREELPRRPHSLSFHGCL